MRKISLRSCLSVVPAVATICISVPAFATKARVQSLQGAEFLIDSQKVFENPSQLHQLGNYFTLELGSAGAASNPKAEGGLYRDAFGGKFGVHLGHVSAEQTTYRALPPGFLAEENPLEVFYGMGNWAASVGMSTSDKKTTDEKQQTMIARFGMTTDMWTAWVNAELLAKADKVNDEFTGGPILRAGGSYNMGNWYLGGRIRSGSLKSEVAGTSTKLTLTDVEIFARDRSIRTASTSIYYGPGIVSSSFKVAGKAKSTLSAPLVAGIEHAYFDWMDLRASISQNFFLLGSTEDKTAAAPGDKKDSIADNATVAAGVGFKKDKFAIDATFSGAATGTFNGNAILANLGLLYSF